ncbi:hypothetical protein HX021_11715 [Sphingobacterium sp. N143]|uniref:hypothetical protein n=1 Tax=Sphingobacterium sp. N143 TaxID=2746727 RepID=UPI0025751116|nr:hypothetical protein [Sphingobacterium sp. N143]MDM1294948.1 hypothetical protein [Sphingobacterium sp. N143]
MVIAQGTIKVINQMDKIFDIQFWEWLDDEILPHFEKNQEELVTLIGLMIL